MRFEATTYTICDVPGYWNVEVVFMDKSCGLRQVFRLNHDLPDRVSAERYHEKVRTMVLRAVGTLGYKESKTIMPKEAK